MNSKKKRKNKLPVRVQNKVLSGYGCEAIRKFVIFDFRFYMGAGTQSIVGIKYISQTPYRDVLGVVLEVHAGVGQICLALTFFPFEGRYPVQNGPGGSLSSLRQGPGCFVARPHCGAVGAFSGFLRPSPDFWSPDFWSPDFCLQTLSSFFPSPGSQSLFF